MAISEDALAIVASNLTAGLMAYDSNPFREGGLKTRAEVQRVSLEVYKSYLKLLQAAPDHITDPPG